MRQPTTTTDGAGNLCVAIVEAVADREVVPATDLTVPLHEAVDTEALERLFEPSGAGGHRRGHVSFEYAGYRVVVDSDRQVSVDPLDASN